MEWSSSAPRHAGRAGSRRAGQRARRKGASDEARTVAIEARQRRLKGLQEQVASIQGALPELHSQAMMLAEIEGHRPLTRGERARYRDVQFQMEAHRLTLEVIRQEFEALRSERASTP